MINQPLNLFLSQTHNTKLVQEAEASRRDARSTPWVRVVDVLVNSASIDNQYHVGQGKRTDEDASSIFALTRQSPRGKFAFRTSP